MSASNYTKGKAASSMLTQKFLGIFGYEKSREK
jgi:hypothetical protein